MYPPDLPSSPFSPAVDLQRLEEVCMGDIASMLELAEFFFSQAEQELAALNLAIQQNSSEEVRRLSHRLLGASAGCGMISLAELFARLEEDAKAGNLQNAAQLFSRLSELLSQSRNEISTWHSSIQNQ